MDVFTEHPFESIISTVIISPSDSSFPFAEEKVKELSPILVAVVVEIRPELTLKE